MLSHIKENDITEEMNIVLARTVDDSKILSGLNSNQRRIRAYFTENGFAIS
jgi:hypothetical protein